MGVPVYFRSILENHPHIIQPIESTIDYLHFDLNCAIHPCCRGLTDETDMFQSILSKIKECILLTNVRKQVFLAIDGPAPRAKMEQQRQRRLRSSLEDKIWDTNAITPGTKFMENLNNFLSKKIKELPVSCILSDSNEPGEGEHKLMKFIDSTPLHTTHYVYGLDADLIMLSMIRKHRIFLLRERTEYNFEQTDDEYVSLNIQLLKQSLVDTLRIRDIKMSDTHLVNDYLFLCFLLGNDFITNLPSINIRYNGIQNLLSVYQSIQRKFIGQFHLLDETLNVHRPHFQYLLNELSLKEEEHIQKIQFIRQKQETKMNNTYRFLFQEYQKKIHHPNNERWDDFMNQLPILQREEEKIIFQKRIHRNKYYSYNLYGDIHWNPSHEDCMKDDVTQLCSDYIQSIVWTTHYYFKSCLSWKWYYPHNFSPLVSDVSKILNTLPSFDTIIQEDKTPYTPEEQLCIVLPKQSHNLLRQKKHLRDKYYYPKETPLHMFLKRYLWECHPMLPH